MSTTIACALIVNGVLYTAWAGDSRCYLFSKGKLKQVTIDHSVVQQPRFRLVCKGNPNLSFDVTQQEIMIGKAPECDISITSDDYVSRQHAKLTITEDSILLEDMNSSNGTFLRIRKQTALKPGDEFLFGTQVFSLEKVIR